MTRLLVHVEGQTEETFVNEVLAPHLYDQGFSSVRARLIGNARQRVRRGGIRSWPVVRQELIRHLKQDRNAFVTTMVDYYGLPYKGPNAWPGRMKASASPFPQRAKKVQDDLAAEVRQAMGGDFDPRRFVPYLMMHEFEALLFSDCARFAAAIDQPELFSEFQRIRDAFENPEAINETPDQTPSKRIEAVYPQYQKPLLGIIAALDIGLACMRTECPHFSRWISDLEALPTRL